MKTFVGVLVALAVVAILLGLLWLRHRLLRGAQVKRSKREFVAREAERDRQAVRAARKSMSAGHGAPREAFVIPGSDGGGSVPAASSPSLQSAVEDRRRAATSTSFDPDLPSS